NRRATQRGSQCETALDNVNAGQLPATQHEVQAATPVFSITAVTAERHLPDVVDDQAMSDVELGGPALCAQIVRVLRFAEDAGVDPRAAAARRDVIDPAGQGFSQRVAH